MAYPTLQDVKDFLGVVGVDDDAYLTLMLAAVIDAIEQYCQRRFEKADDEDTWLELNFEKHLFVSRFPLATVTSVEINGSATTDYEIHQKTGLVLLDRKSSGKVVVSYNGGFDPIPGTITALINQAVRDAYLSKDSDNSVGAIKSERVDGAVTLAYFDPDSDSSGGTSVNNAPPLISKYARALDPYMSDKAVGASV